MRARVGAVRGHGPVAGPTISFFDLNQLELAFINRVLRGKKTKIPDIVEIGNKARILRIQKVNLEQILRRHGKERREDVLEKELEMILSGSRIFSFFPQRR